MKNKTFLSTILLLSLLTITACDNNKSSNSNSNGASDTPASDSKISVNPKPTSSAKEVFDFLKSAGSSTNFTLEIPYDATTSLHITYNPHYIYYDLSDAGYIQIDSYKGNNEKLLYNFSNKSKVQIENAVSYNDPLGNRFAVSSPEEMNALNDGVKDLTEADISANWDYYFTKNKNLITGFAYVINATKYVGSIEAIKFALNEDKTELSFQFVPNFSSLEDSEVVDTLNGKITKVGKSSVSELDAFLASYSLPSESLSDSLITSLAGKQAFHSVVNYNYDGKVSVDQEDKVIMEEGKKQIVRSSGSSTNSKSFYYTKDSSTGHAIRRYLNYKNVVVDEDTGDMFDNIAPHISSLIEKDAFRKTSENTYTYFGYNGRGFISKLLDYEPGEILSITLTTSENKVSSIHALSTLRYDTYGKKMYYDITIDFGQDYEYKSFTPHEEPSDNMLKFALNAYDNEGKYSSYVDFQYSFKATLSTNTGVGVNNYKKTISVVKRSGVTSKSYGMNTIIIDQESVDTEEGTTGDPIHIITGFFETSTGLAPFKVTEDNKVIASGPERTGKKLKDFFNMNISYQAFEPVEVKEDGTHTFRLYDDIENVSDHVFGYNNINSIIPSSLTMEAKEVKVDEYTSNKALTKIEYEFNGYGMFKGTETIEFSDYGTTVLPEELDFSTFGDWVAPTTWDKGAANVYEKLIGEEKFTAEQIALVPFLYSDKIEGNWDVDVTNDGTYLWACIFNDTYAASDSDTYSEGYLADYVQLLKDNGFVEKDYPLANKGDGTQLYKDGVYVRIPGDSLMSGIRILVELK